ncbi:hypothetical protein Barb6_01962 [Bacteroidales bacterium Barb6]|nr:hypothetical protein Barb6_01962 [Bacteroidales bacterium Barb6]
MDELKKEGLKLDKLKKEKWVYEFWEKVFNGNIEGAINRFNGLSERFSETEFRASYNEEGVVVLKPIETENPKDETEKPNNYIQDVTIRDGKMNVIGFGGAIIPGDTGAIHSWQD